MNNMNIDENTMKNIKNMVDNGNISDAISSISPEMIQNFSKMLSNQNNNGTSVSADANNNSNTKNINTTNPRDNTSSPNMSNSSNTFDISGIDMNTVMKMSSFIQKMNNTKNDPRANLLNSLKPYLRDSKKEKLDNYMNLLNVTKIAEIMKEGNKEKNKENNDV